MRNGKIYGIVLCGVFAAVIAILSQIAIPLPGMVPITLQTYGVALCGYFLGTAKSAAAITAYILVGAVGAPVFSGFKGGFAVLAGPTGGFIIGFILMTALCGIKAGARLTRSAAVNVIVKFSFGLLGIAALHLCGTLWYCVAMGTDPLRAFVTVSLPFLAKDALSVALAYFTAQTALARIRKNARIQ